MKFKHLVLGVALSASSVFANAAVCNVIGKVTKLIPSAGVAGLQVDSNITGCECQAQVMWIDTNSMGGMAMFSAAKSAMLSSKVVNASIEDGKGQGAPGNLSVTYRYWATCQLMALEVVN